MADYDLLQALRSFAVAMGGSYDFTEMSYELCDRTVKVLSASGAGVSVPDERGDLKFITATDQTIVEFEEAQEKAQEGPCVTSFTSQQPVVIPDVQLNNCWPAYSAVISHLKMHAVVGYPVTYGGRRLGALNVYNADPREWNDDDLDVLGVLAHMAVAYLLRASELAEARQLAAQLQTAPDSRVSLSKPREFLRATTASASTKRSPCSAITAAATTSN